MARVHARMIPLPASDAQPWSLRVRLSEIQRSAPALDLTPDAAQRAALAKMLDLVELKSLSASVGLSPWLDGVELQGRWRAEIVQTCSLTAEPFETPLTGDFMVRAVPHDSPAAIAEDAEVSIDPQAEDPPDTLLDDQIDVAAYVVEHLALEIDPFARKPGAAFEPPVEAQLPSPFSVLSKLALRDDAPPDGKA